MCYSEITEDYIFSLKHNQMCQMFNKQTLERWGMCRKWMMPSNFSEVCGGLLANFPCGLEYVAL